MISIDYRPSTLDKVIGHEKTILEVKNRFLKNNFPKVSIFSGYTGIGKTTISYICSKIIQCQNKINEFTPCNKCSSCLDISKESFMQGTFMYNCSNVDIETMRDIEELSRTVSFVSQKKVIILEELQELGNNKKAMKNILKLLEKDSEDIHFIMTTMDLSKIDKAILNRAVTYKLYPIDYMKIAEYLYNVCTDMKLDLDEAKSDILFTVAQNSGGSVRQACAYLERVIEGNIWNQNELIDILHITTDKQINEIALKLIDKDPEVFEKDLTEEVLQKVKSALIDFSKVLVGAKIDSWRYNSLNGLIGYKNANIQNVYEVISVLNEFFRFPYLNKEIIDSVLIKLFLNKEPKKVLLQEEPKPVTVVEETPKRRRVV